MVKETPQGKRHVAFPAYRGRKKERGAFERLLRSLSICAALVRNTNRCATVRLDRYPRSFGVIFQLSVSAPANPSTQRWFWSYHIRENPANMFPNLFAFPSSSDTNVLQQNCL